jgi:hypothetical protein
MFGVTKCVHVCPKLFGISKKKNHNFHDCLKKFKRSPVLPLQFVFQVSRCKSNTKTSGVGFLARATLVGTPQVCSLQMAGLVGLPPSAKAQLLDAHRRPIGALATKDSDQF